MPLMQFTFNKQVNNLINNPKSVSRLKLMQMREELKKNKLMQLQKKTVEK